jgi:hypothetical protein
MKSLLPITTLALVVSTAVSSAATLDETSLAPAWVTASAAEKQAYVTAFKYKHGKIPPATIAACLDDYAARPIFATNALAGVTRLCETVKELPGPND